MKCLVLLILVIGSATCMPSRHERASALDLLEDLENIIETEGKELIGKLLNAVHHLEDGVLQIKELVPKVYEKIHEECDEILRGLKKVTDEVEELLGKKNAFLSYGIFDGLTELTGGTKLSTVFTLMSLADKANRVANDAKGFMPRLQKEMEKIQDKARVHMMDFLEHVKKELGVEDFVSYSVTKNIEDLFNHVEDEFHVLILDVLHNVEQALLQMENNLPEVSAQLSDKIRIIRNQIQEIMTDIEKTLVMRSFSLLDLAGHVTSGTDIGRVMKVLSLMEKFNRVVQDAKQFEPKAEVLLHHVYEKVQVSVTVMMDHASEKLFKGFFDE